MAIITTESQGTDATQSFVQPSEGVTTPGAQPTREPEAPETTPAAPAPETPADADAETPAEAPESAADDAEDDDAPEEPSDEPRKPKTRSQRYKEAIQAERAARLRTEQQLAEMQGYLRALQQQGAPREPQPVAPPPILGAGQMTEEQFYAQHPEAADDPFAFIRWQATQDAVQALRQEQAAREAAQQQQQFQQHTQTAAQRLAAEGRQQFADWDDTVTQVDLPPLPLPALVELGEHAHGAAVLRAIIREHPADLGQVSSLMQRSDMARHAGDLDTARALAVAAQGLWQRVLGRVEGQKPWEASKAPAPSTQTGARASRAPEPLAPVSPGQGSGGYDPAMWESKTQFNGDDFRTWMKHEGLHTRRSL